MRLEDTHTHTCVHTHTHTHTHTLYTPKSGFSSHLAKCFVPSKLTGKA